MKQTKEKKKIIDTASFNESKTKDNNCPNYGYTTRNIKKCKQEKY